MKVILTLIIFILCNVVLSQTIFDNYEVDPWIIIKVKYAEEEILWEETSNKSDDKIRCIVTNSKAIKQKELSNYPNLECLYIQLGDHRKFALKGNLLPVHLKYLFVTNSGMPTKLLFKGKFPTSSLKAFSGDQIVFNKTPEFIYKCDSLELLYLMLADTFSIDLSKIGKLNKIKQLFLLYNSNSLKFDTILYNLKDLEELFLFSSEDSKNPIIVDNRIKKLSKLKYITLNVEFVPEAIWDIGSIEHIELRSRNSVRVGTGIGCMQNLRKFSIETSELPDSFFALKELESFFNTDSIFNICLYDFSVFPNLTTLSIYELNDSTISSISKLKSVRYLYVDKFSVNDMDKIKDLHFIDQIQVREDIGIATNRLIRQKLNQGKTERKQ